jgi:cytochrome c biogenesis protein CcmG/thiol:disulfide interchange protein DsbE
MQNRIDRLLLGSIALLLITFVGVLAKTLDEHMVKQGDTAPHFTVRTDSGRTIGVPDFQGKVLILNFWASWCAPCIEEMPSLDVLQKRFAGQGVTVLGVSIDTDVNAYRKFLATTPVGFETAMETADRVNMNYGTLQVPETYIIDRSGKVVQKIVGKENWSDERVINYVQSLL